MTGEGGSRDAGGDAGLGGAGAAGTGAAGAANTAASTVAGTRVRLRPLTLVDEGDDVVVGDPASATFVSLPRVGAVVIRALQRGATLEETAAEAELAAGEPVDVPDFVEGLRELGFVVDGDPGDLDPDDLGPGPGPDGGGDVERHTGRRTGAGGSASQPVRTAAVQQRRWVAAVPPALARPLFSPVAWCVYGAALAFSVACLALVPALWPRPRDALYLGDAGLSILAVMPFTYLFAALHEAWHWLAARALGLSVRFGIDRRLWLLVFETDLSQLWAVPRRQRYGPQLAGLAIDAVLLAALLGAELLAETGRISPPPLLARVLAALVFLKVAGMLWQCLVFLRTDLYAVLVTATGCRDLWRVKSLLLRQAFGWLSAEQAAEVAEADPRDLRVGRWFRWVYLAGLVAALAYAAYFYLPVLAALLAWTAAGLAEDPSNQRFWLTAAGSVVLYLPLGAALALWAAGSWRGRRRGTLSGSR